MFSVKLYCLAIAAVILHFKFPYVSGHDASEPRPLGYQVELRANTENSTFDGEVTITVRTVRKEKKIKLSSQSLDIKSVNVEYAGEMPIRESHQIDMDDERLTIDVGNLLAGDHTVQISYDGRINDKSIGLFSTTCYSPKPTMIGGVILEPMNARAVFPSFDVDERSTPVNISLSLDKPYRAITPMTASTMSAGLNQNILLSFDDIRLSQIGWAFYPNDGSVVELPKDGHMIATCRPNLMTLHLTNLTREIKDYFDFEMKPTQWVLMPNLPTPFASGKNIIFIREHLMENSSYTNDMDLLENLLSVTEALSSQLFGQAIRAESWSDVWLTKGLAKFTSYKLVEKIHSESRLKRYIAGSVLPKTLDRETIPHSLSKHAHSKKGILSMFDEDLYQRAALVLRMIEDKVGENTFRRALSHFVNKTISKGVANSNDLWSSLQQFSLDFPPGETVDEVLKSWIYSAGYPVVKVRRENDYLIITQDSIIKDSKHTPDGVGYWWIPITVTSQSIRGPRKFWLRPKGTLRVNLPLNDNWYIINENGKGFYRVNYDAKNWMNLSDAATNGELEEMTKARLLDDSFGLAESSRLPYRIALLFTKHLSNRPTDVSWSAVIRHLVTLRTLMEASPQKDLDEYLASRIENYVLGERISMEDVSDESSENMTTIKYIVREIDFGTMMEKGCLSDMMINDSDSVVDDWMAVYAQHLSPTHERKIIKALSCLPHLHQRRRMLDAFVNSSWGTQREDFVNAIAVMSYSEKRVDEILEWMLQNPLTLNRYISQDIDMLSNIVTTLSEQIYSDSTANKLKSVLVGLKQWADDWNQSELNSNQIHRSFLRIEMNKRRRREHSREILDWLSNPDAPYVFSTASSKTLSTLLLLCFILTFLQYTLY